MSDVTVAEVLAYESGRAEGMAEVLAMIRERGEGDYQITAGAMRALADDIEDRIREAGQ